MRETLLNELASYPLCDFFLRHSVETMSDQSVTDDLASEPDLSLLQHFSKPQQMALLEGLFGRTMNTFGLSKESLRAQAEFNFDVYNISGFESVRAVFRLANALSEKGFAEFRFLQGKGVADLSARRDECLWFIEAKALVLQTKPYKASDITEVLRVDKFQPATCSIQDYVESVSRQIAGGPVEKALNQLSKTIAQEGKAKKMIGIVLNLFNADFFLDAENLGQVHARLQGKMAGWQKNYLAGVDTVAFLTNQLHLYNCSPC